MNRGLLLAGAAGLVLVLVCLSWSARRLGRAGHPAQGTSSAAVSPRRTMRPVNPAVQAERLLPFTPTQLTEAAQLAQAFVAAYSTHRYNESPTEYIERLAPMMRASLRAVIERTATDPAVLVQRQRAQEVAVAEARTEAIRELGPASIMFLVAATEHITTTYAARQDTARYAVTLTTGSDGWRVHDVELAAAGQSGDSSGIP
ncbi:hypothetical protein GCM10029978_046460 [Actinoallomurus acanthiterrae]